MPDPMSLSIAPQGLLRVAINLGNPVLACLDGTTGEPAGISADMARQLAQRSTEAQAYLDAFVEGLKETGWVAQALATHHIKGVAVPPLGHGPN